MKQIFVPGEKGKKMSDLIERQAAIDVIEEYADRLQMVNWKENPSVPYKAYALNWCINTIRDLPSAQPTTDAIPVEWITNKVNELRQYAFGTPENDDDYYKRCTAHKDLESLKTVLYLWRDENEK